MHQFVDAAHLVQWQAHDVALLGDGLQNALANPPNGVRYELEASGLVEFLCSLDQSSVALADESQRLTPWF